MDDWEVVRTLGTEEEASLVAGFLASRGFEAKVESLRFHQEPVNFGKLGEVRVLVPSAALAEAREALEDLDAGVELVADDAGAEDAGDDGEEN
jgi:hypothetical protein